MRDPRLGKLAEIMMERSLNVKKGDIVVVRAPYEARPLVDECFRAIIERGGTPYLDLIVHDYSRMLVDKGSDEQYEKLNDIKMSIYEKADCFITIDAPLNTRNMASAEPDRNVAITKAMAPNIREITAKRWVVTNFPTQSLAQEADMSIDEYWDMFFDAVLVDYEELDRKMDKVLKKFDTGKQVRIIGRNTDLSFSIEGRPGIKCSGVCNVPDGEVYYAPVENSVNGHIYYDFPIIRYGVQVDNVQLEFKDGKVIAARSSSNEEFLNKILDTDPGARYLGEFGIGLNYGIKRYIKNILFDEKIGGTIHLAVGQAYEDSMGTNSSSIHWDMIKDLRREGELYLDGILVMKNGEWLI